MNWRRPTAIVIVFLLGLTAVAIGVQRGGARRSTDPADDNAATATTSAVTSAMPPVAMMAGEVSPAPGPVPSASASTATPSLTPKTKQSNKVKQSKSSGKAGYPSVWIKGVGHVRQKPDFCGEAAAAAYLQRLGYDVDQDYVFDQSGLDPMHARGCYTKELDVALKRIGFETGTVWYQATRDRETADLEQQWRSLHADLLAGVPSIVCMHYDEQPNTTEHFRLVLGYDAESDEILYHEPAEAQGGYRRMKRSLFYRLWPLRYRAETSTVVRLALRPAGIRPLSEAQAAAIRANRHSPADYAQHLMQLKRKMPAEGFTIVVEKPFVVIGDESAAAVRRRAEGTVKWAVDRLKEAYFAKDPDEILDIWLFKDDASYRDHAQEIFGHAPSTPYGYFSGTDRALVMNIATGGGTLVHEIVHPFVAANFPKCPAWFNEGLGSLYEQSASRDGKIVGLTNWRLAGLQQAIGKKRVPSFQTLCSTTTNEFYNVDPGTNYAQARYLCYYLQEHKLLRKFYREFFANHETDPTGYATLQTVLDRDDMPAFQKEWEAWVMKLRFP